MRVLLVEDSAPLARILQRGLEEEGFAVDLAADGEEADYKARATAYDAIVLDLVLPKKDGLTVLKGWRTAGIKTHVLVLTARTGVPDRVRGLDSGADDYLTKPFEFPEFLARVRALIRRGHHIKDPLLRVHDLDIDTTDRTVRRAGKVIHLTPREYALLELLAFHAGKVVPRAAIWEHLWDEHDESVSNVVDVYIRTLRLKVDKDFFPPLIITRWGQGYMLRGDEPVAISR
ncbi:MAG TPA: response regulator transcription factor [Gemmataceae bacterium]|nr:response regulator transcription factor [Gemmataceae bacterium]